MKTRLTLLFCVLTLVACAALPQVYTLDIGERGESYAHAAALSYEVHHAFGMGSGWAWDHDTLVTNWHVVSTIAALPSLPSWVEQGNTEWVIDSIERLPGIDGALVHVIGPPLNVGQRGLDPILGDELLMVGSPHDSVTPVVTWGLVGGVYGDSYSDKDMAVDGAIIPGMSGGPVVAKDGSIVGMNVATTSPPGRSIGIIIPLSEVLYALEELERLATGSPVAEGG